MLSTRTTGKSVGFDDYTDEENATLRQMSRQELRQYVLEHPLDYRSLTDEEIAQCIQLLEAENEEKNPADPLHTML